MFENLTDRLGGIFDGLRKNGVLKEEDIATALREVRIALLEADVALPVAKSFVNKVKENAVGEKIIRSVSPGQQVVKIVHDTLVETLGTEVDSLNIDNSIPAIIMMTGLQGSGKTTSSAKIALYLKKKLRKKVLMASLDVQRPAAQEQLAILGEQTETATLEIIKGQNPLQITERAIKTAKQEGFDVVILDTAGRLSIDDELMTELESVKKLANPNEILLVADAMTGQDAVTTADNFNQRIGIDGIVLTRVDGDARGGAALSMREVTGKAIKFMGTGEKIDELQPFYPSRIADRILGMGDVVSLVEKAADTIDREEAEKMAKKMQKGKFDLDDFASQLKQMRNMGGLEGIMSMMPGMGKIKSMMADANVDDSMINRQEAILSSMTKKERATPALLNASRRKRIATGAGASIQEVNKLLKQFQQMQGMMKKLKKLGGKGLMKSLGSMLGGKGGMPDMSEMEALAENMGKQGFGQDAIDAGDGPLGANPFLDNNAGGGLGENPFAAGGMPMDGMPQLGATKKLNKRKKAQLAKKGKK